MKITEKWVKPGKLTRLPIFFWKYTKFPIKKSLVTICPPIGDLESVLSLYYNKSENITKLGHWYSNQHQNSI